MVNLRSTGCVLYEIIAGKRLFTNVYDILNTNSKKLENESLNKILKQMIEPNQNERISARNCL